ncbi:MAG: hypothetical protein ACXWU1_14525 [Allosphingosinicella sp.]
MSDFIHRLLVLAGPRPGLGRRREAGAIPPVLPGRELRAGRLR